VVAPVNGGSWCVAVWPCEGCGGMLSDFGPPLRSGELRAPGERGRPLPTLEPLRVTGEHTSEIPILVLHLLNAQVDDRGRVCLQTSNGSADHLSETRGSRSPSKEARHYRCAAYCTLTRCQMAKLVL